MSDRMVGVLLAIVGVFAVAIFALLGFDAWRAARTGPRWRRRLVGAGLSLLALVGVSPAASAAEAPANLVAADGKPLADSPEWKALDATWREASEIASGRRGPYPFDEAGKARALAAFDGAGKNLAALQAKGLVSEAEAGLLGIELGRLTRGVQAMRPTEMRNTECYRPMSLGYRAKQTVERLAARLPLLEKLASAQQLRPVVVRKVLAAVEADLATLADERELIGYPPADKPKMEETRKVAAALVVRLKAALPQPEDPKAK